MRLPRLRFTIRRMMVVVTVFGVVTVELINLPEAAWVGHASIPLEFVILDALTGQPLEGASIRLVESTPEYEATTGAEGRSKIIINAMIGGRSSLVRNTRVVNYAWALVVTADHYRGVNEPLWEVARGPRYHSDPAPPPIVVRPVPCRWACNEGFARN